MRLVTWSDSFVGAFRKSASETRFTFEPYRAYVMSDEQLGRMCQDKKIVSLVLKSSALRPRLNPFHAAVPYPKRKVLFYNGSGGYGDQVTAWPVARILAQSGYEIHILSDPGNQGCWWHFGWVKSLQTLPMDYELFKMFDHHVMMAPVCDADEHPDQEHPTDRMLRLVGLNPESIDPKYKIVKPVFSPGEEARADKTMPDKKLAMYQLTSAVPTRALSTDGSILMLKKLAEAFPDLHWLALFDQMIPEEYVTAVKELGLPNIQPFNAAILRELWALTRRAQVVVGPDSMMVHVAGALGRPTVGLWGPFEPAMRIKYYTNHIPIWHKESCRWCPCHHYGANLPVRLCPPRPDRKTCEVMEAISPDEVIEAVKKVL